MKKMLAAVMVLVLLMVLSYSVVASELGTATDTTDENDVELSTSTEYPTGALPIPDEVLEAIQSDPDRTLVEDILASVPQSRTNLQRVNLSNLKYFPLINAQQYGSCSAWSTVYYMYTYEVNRLHDTSATVTDQNGNVMNNYNNVYSPTWNYSLFSEDSSSGTYTTDYFEFSKQHGQLPIMQCPTYTSAYPYPSVPTNSTQIMEALSTRISDYDFEYIDTTTEQIFEPTSIKLDDVKDLLAAGHVLSVTTYSDYAIKDTSTGEKCIYRVGNNGSGHAITVVGYDNEVQCDINGDSIYQTCEKGAFIIANSWGDAWGNDGFIYVSYDALNLTSAVPGMWQDEFTTERTPAFCLGATTKYNYFWVIEVEDYDPDLIVLTDIQPPAIDNTNSIESTYFRIERDDNDTNIAQMKYYGSSSDKTPFERAGKVAFDCAELATPLSDCVSGYTWKFKLMDRGALTQTEVAFYDDLSTFVKAFQYQDYLDYWYCDLDLMVGDLDYSGGITTADAFKLYDYTSSGGILSDLQIALSDINEDGAVNATDAFILYNQISGASRASGKTEQELYDEFIRAMEEYRAQLLAAQQ